MLVGEEQLLGPNLPAYHTCQARPSLASRLLSRDLRHEMQRSPRRQLPFDSYGIQSPLGVELAREKAIARSEFGGKRVVVNGT